MLKITITETLAERRWIVQGQSVEPRARLKRHHSQIELEAAVHQILRSKQTFKEEQRS